MRTQVKQVVHAAGLSGVAQRALELRSPSRRRDRIDHETLHQILKFSLTSAANCVDIGCNRGSVLRCMTQLAPAGNHHAFEPLPELAAELKDAFPNVAVHQMALSETAGTAQFTRVIGNDGYSGLSDRGLDQSAIEKFDVPVSTLDEILPDDYRPDFIKIDVEGAEYHVLKGADRVLKGKPPIWFEHGSNGSGLFGITSEELWDLITSYGYEITDADGNGPLHRDEFAACLGRVWDFLAH